VGLGLHRITSGARFRSWAHQPHEAAATARGESAFFPCPPCTPCHCQAEDQRARASPRRERELGLPGRLREKRTHQRLKASTTTLRAGRHAFVMLANRQGYCELTPAVVTVVFVHRHSWSSPWLRTPLAAPRTGPRLVSIHRAHSTASRTARSERWWVRGWLDSWSMCSTLGFVLPLQRRPPGACSPSPSQPPSTSVISLL